MDEGNEMMRRRHIIPLLLVACVALFTLLVTSCAARDTHSASSGPASLGRAAVSGGLVVGLSEGAAGWGSYTTAPRLTQLTSRTHTKWMRDSFLWSRIEPSRNRFHFSYYDHYMLLAARRGLHIVAQLGGTPAWSGRTAFSIPSNPYAFVRYLTAVVRRYGPHGSFWRRHPRLSGSAITTFELWNEPYFDSGNGGHYDPGRYARLVKAAGAAGHAADPSTKFLLESEMQPHHDKVWVWWTDALYHAVPDLNHYFDGVAVHDFGDDTRTLDPIVPGKPYGNFGHVRRIEDLRRQFISHAAAGKPFWIMESGWSTCTQRSVDCVTDARQAANLATLFNYVHTTWEKWVQAAFVYRYKDGAQPETVQDGYGLVDLNGKPKPALRLFKTFAAASAG